MHLPHASNQQEKCVPKHSKVTFTDMVPADANDPDPGGVLHASVDASWKSSWARHSDVPILAKCVRLGLLVSLLARFHGPPCSRTTRRHCLARQFSRPKRYASCRGAYSLHGHLYGHTCHSSCFTRVAHMCHDMTVSYGLCSWHPWGWQGPPATEGGLTGPPR